MNFSRPRAAWTSEREHPAQHSLRICAAATWWPPTVGAEKTGRRDGR